MLAERHCPGKFQYAIAARIFGPAPNDTFAIRAKESLAAYGINDKRLFPIAANGNYNFSELYYVTSVQSDFAFHPIAIEIMQKDVRGTMTDQMPASVALLRGDNTRREIANLADVLAVILERRMLPFDIALLPFTTQVCLFRAANKIFTVLGTLCCLV